MNRKAIRLGQTFTMAEALHMCKLFELIETSDLAAVRRVLRDKLGLSLRKKALSMRQSALRQMEKEESAQAERGCADA